jgi:hypothetical protein
VPFSALEKAKSQTRVMLLLIGVSVTVQLADEIFVCTGSARGKGLDKKLLQIAFFLLFYFGHQPNSPPSPGQRCYARQKKGRRQGENMFY